MADYMTLHASAYPPTSWAFIANRQPKHPQNFSNELWTEMTIKYEISMAKRHHDISSHKLSKTATSDNIGRMSREAKKLYRQQAVIEFKDAADVHRVLNTAGRFVKAVDKLLKEPMDTIPEEDEAGAIHPRRQPTEREILQIKQAIRKSQDYQRLQNTDEIKDAFRKRLSDIYSAYHEFIVTPVDKHPRPRFAQICRMDKEVTAHVAHVGHVAHVQQELTSDVAQLKDFLRGQLFDEYCLMRETPVEKKNETWLQYGRCLMSRQELGDRELGERLDRMIDASGLDRNWVTDHIDDYYQGDDHIGKWQRYAQAYRWNDLAAKLSTDIQQLQKINSSKSRRCKIMINICNTRRQFFKRLDGAQDFELSKKALNMR